MNKRIEIIPTKELDEEEDEFYQILLCIVANIIKETHDYHKITDSFVRFPLHKVKKDFQMDMIIEEDNNTHALTALLKIVEKEKLH